jgi:hypothetical protein
MTNEQAFAAWAAQKPGAQGKAANGSVIYLGRTLWSYGPHYVLGLFLPSGLQNDENPVVLLNSTKVSTTTSKHRTGAVRALLRSGSKPQIIDCPDLTRLYRDLLAIPGFRIESEVSETDSLKRISQAVFAHFERFDPERESQASATLATALANSL